MLARLRRLDASWLELIDADGRHACGSREGGALQSAMVHDPRFYRTVALGGSLGAGRAFVEGYWSADDLLTTLRRFAAPAIESAVESVAAWPLAAARAVRRLARLNTRRGSRRNIRAHYDLSNEFFAQFLDPTMTYSCGLFDAANCTLAAAQTAKYERIAERLQLAPSDHVLEIGCGWGGFAEHAARRYGCRVTAVTISTEQHRYAVARIAAAGLADRVEVQLRDYRDLSGQYDKLASIEMIEAVGHEFLPRFFGQCRDLLKPGGLMALQAITIPDQRYDRYRRGVDFIQEYIFPGGCVPSIGAIRTALGRATDFRVLELEDFASDYARTLLEWRRSFAESESRIAALGFDERFRRAWDYYFCYCAAGFLEQQIGLCQMTLARPAS